MKPGINKNLIEAIPKEVLVHLDGILSDCGIVNNKKNLTRAAESWLSKRGLFDRIIEHGKFKRVEIFLENDVNACIAITLSGSIVTLGPAINEVRHLIYTNTGIRTDIGDIYIEPKCVINGNITVGKSIIFTRGPILKTSPIIDIATIPDEDNLERQFSRIKAANDILQYRFLNINREFIESTEIDDKLIKRNDLFEQWIILDWFRIGGIDALVFYARSKILWLDLFSHLYDFLTDNISVKNDAVTCTADTDASFKDRDRAFLELQNKHFALFIDVYKWVESEKKDFDIGIMKALEEIPELDQYREFCKKYKDEIHKH